MQGGGDFFIHLTRYHCSTPQHSSEVFEAPPFEIPAVIFPDKMRQKTNSVTDGLCMALGMMMLSVCRHHRFDDGSDVNPDRIQLLAPLLSSTPRITSSASSASFRQRQAVKYHCVLIFSIGVSEIIKIKYHILFEKRYSYDILFIQ